MRTWNWERIAPLAGALGVLLWLVAVLILEGADRPADDAPTSELTAYFNDQTGSIFAAYFFWGLGGALVLWFLGSLRSALAAAEGGVGRLTSVAFGAGVATVAFALAFPAPEVAGAIAADNSDRTLSPEAAEALWNVGVGFFVAAEFTAAVLLVATAFVALRTRVLPAWLAWASLVLAVGLLILPIGWAVLILAFPLWVIVTSVLLWRSTPVAPAGTTPAASTAIE